MSRCCFPRLLASGYQCNLQRTLQHLKSNSQYWCPKPITDGGHVGVPNQSSFLLITLSFGLINLPSYWPRKWKHSIEVQVGLHKIFYVSQSASGVPLTRPTQETSTQFFNKRHHTLLSRNTKEICYQKWYLHSVKISWYLHSVKIPCLRAKAHLVFHWTPCLPCRAFFLLRFSSLPKIEGGRAPPLDPPLLKN